MHGGNFALMFFILTMGETLLPIGYLFGSYANLIGQPCKSTIVSIGIPIFY